MVARRPRFGPVRQQAYDAARAAEAAIVTTSQQGQKSLLQLTSALLKLIATATEVADEILDGAEVQVKIGTRIIPISLIFNIDEDEDKGEK